MEQNGGFRQISVGPAATPAALGDPFLAAPAVTLSLPR